MDYILYVLAYAVSSLIVSVLLKIKGNDYYADVFMYATGIIIIISIFIIMLRG